MTIGIEDYRHNLRILISQMNRCSGKKAEYAIKIFGGKSVAYNCVYLGDDELRNIVSFLEIFPIGPSLIVGQGRIELRVELRESLFGEKVAFFMFRLYDKVEEKGYSQIEFVVYKYGWKCTEIDSSVRKCFVVSPYNISSLADNRNHNIDNSVNIVLSMNNNQDNEYYYDGHISICTPCFMMESDLLIEKSEAETFSQRLHLLLDKGQSFSFSPMSEMVDITFRIEDGLIYAKGDISDTYLLPTHDYVFDYVLSPTTNVTLKNIGQKEETILPIVFHDR